MSKDALYATPRMMEDFLIPHYHRTGQRLSFQETLLKMAEQNRLSEEPLPRPALSRTLPTQQFMEAFLDMPFDAGLILDSLERSYTDIFREERAAFPPGQDVFCRKVLPCASDESRSLSYFDIFYVVSGSCDIFFGEAVTLRAGDVCIVPPDTVHAVTVGPDASVANLVIRASTFDAHFGDLLTRSGTLSGFFRESLYRRSQSNYLLLHTPAGDSNMGFHLKCLAVECYSSDTQTNSCVISWMKLFLAQALRACGDGLEVFRTPSGGSTRADCGEILQYIQQNYRTVRLSTLARQFHYNETYLSRMLQNFAHKSFTEIVRDIRMKRAEEYLNNSSLRVHEIASLVGYSSVDHFSRAFKSTHDMSPQAYRRRAGREE